MKVKSLSRVRLLDCGPPGSSVHGIFQARVLEWGATAFPSNGGDPGSIPGLGRSIGEGIGYPLQYSALKNSSDCLCIAHGVTKSRKRLSDFHFHFLRLSYIHLTYLHLHICLFSIKDSTFLIGSNGFSQVLFIGNV